MAHGQKSSRHAAYQFYLSQEAPCQWDGRVSSAVAAGGGCRRGVTSEFQRLGLLPARFPGMIGEGCQGCFKVLLSENHPQSRLISKRSGDADASSRGRSLELGAPPPHTGWAVNLGRSDHSCLHRTESNFFHCIFFNGALI